MPQERKDKEYGNRTGEGVITLIVLLMLVGMFLIPALGEPPHLTIGGFIIGVILLTILIIGSIKSSRLRSRYCCPQCGAQLPPLRAEMGARCEHRFLCQNCDILWVTGVYEGDSPL